MTEVGLPKFEQPPVIEALLGVQFNRILRFYTAHVGWFWREFLGPEWTEVREATRIDDFKEHFGPDRLFIAPSVKVREAPESNRIQFIAADRMIQVQDSRLVYNWIKSTDTDLYPSYREMLPAFRDIWGRLQAYCDSAGFGKLTPNQWEVTYVNNIPRGPLWQEPHEWNSVVRNPWIPERLLGEQQFDGLQSEWRYLIGNGAGRLRIQLQHARLESGKGDEVLLLKLVARGPVDDAHELFEGLDLGHRSIVTSFAEMTTPKAHETWKRTQ